MEITPASVVQVARGRGGRMVEIDDDVGGVAVCLREIDAGLRLRFSEAGGYFVVYHRERVGEQFKEQLVTTSQTCDARLVKRVAQIAAEGYDFGAELDRLDAQADRDQEHRFSEQVGELGERLSHALRKDLGVKGSVHLSRRG